MQNNRLIYPVILCGGSGTRLWPLSRKSYPKQFSSLLGEQSLFQSTVRRLSHDQFARPLLLTNDQFRFIVVEQMAQLEKDAAAILIEPEARNTAPAVLAAAHYLAQQDPDALMLVVPSDHAFSDDTAFCHAVEQACEKAMAGDLITFGIQPTRAETGYGYLELAGSARVDADHPQALQRFVEKPDLAKAEAMLKTGNHLWNAGIFLFSARSIIKAYETYAADMVGHVCAAVSSLEQDLGFARLASEPWSKCDDISIDYAIMERADNLGVMPLSAGWTDLGGWESVWLESDKDEQGNVVSDHAMTINCRDTLLRSESERLELVGVGLDNIVAVAMPDAVLVANKSESQKIRDAVAELKARSVPQAVEFPKDHRPWGWYERLITQTRFQVKRIHVYPGASLSLQSHHHRAEHWIIVAGTAKVTIDETVQLVTENQSVYIPIGAVHRIENPGKVPVVFIEVQTGSYLGEDDIIRYEDIYSRK